MSYFINCKVTVFYLLSSFNCHIKIFVFSSVKCPLLSDIVVILFLKILVRMYFVTYIKPVFSQHSFAFLDNLRSTSAVVTCMC